MDADALARLPGDQKSFLAHPTHSLGLSWLFYGSLRAPEVFEIVVGRPMDSVAFETVSLERYELARILAGDGFPGIFPTDDPVTLTCLMTDALSPVEELRVAWYEWDEYKLGEFGLSDGRRAQAFVPDVAAIHRVHGAIDFQPWSFEDWQIRYLKDAIPGAKEWMAAIPDISTRPELGPSK